MSPDSSEAREQKLEIRRAERAEKARSVFPLFPELRGRTWLEFLREELSDEPALSFENDDDDPNSTSVDVYSARGHIFVYLSREKMRAYGSLWDRGVCAGELSSPSLSGTVAFLRAALARATTIAEIQSEMSDFRAYEAGLVQDNGAEAYLDYRWQELLQYLEESSKYLMVAQVYRLAQIASQQPQLRQLRAYTSHNRFCFSRCAGFPFTSDCPSAQPFGEDYFQVYADSATSGWHENPIGFGNAEQAAQMLANALPPNCGPAVLGTADDLEN